MTIVTDLVTAHLSWLDAGADQIVVPTAPLRHRCQLDGIPANRCAEIGLPVGAEGSGGLYRRTAALVRRSGDTDVAVVCGRNHLLRRRLNRLARRAGQRLTVCGYISNMAD